MVHPLFGWLLTDIGAIGHALELTLSELPGFFQMAWVSSRMQFQQ